MNVIPRCKQFIGKFNDKWFTAICIPQFQFVGEMDAILIWIAVSEIQLSSVLKTVMVWDQQDVSASKDTCC